MNNGHLAFDAILCLLVVTTGCAGDKLLTPLIVPSEIRRVYAPDDEPTCPYVSETCAWELPTQYVTAPGGTFISWIEVGPIPDPPVWGQAADPNDPSAYPDATAVANDCAPGTVPTPDFPIPTDDFESVCPRGADNICIDLWIKDSAVLGLKGDQRESDPEAQPRNSRAQIVITLNDVNQSYFTVSPSCVTISNKNQCFPPLPTGTGGNNVVINRSGDGSITVDFTLRTSAMTIPGIHIPLGPAINGYVRMTPTGNGRYAADVQRNQFPSMGIFAWINGQRIKIVEFNERNPFFLFDWVNKLSPASGGTCRKW